MIRSLTAAIGVAAALACGSVGADDKDPVKEKLFAAKVAYDKEMAQFRTQAGDWFDKREETARKDGNKKLVDQIKDERKAFDESGTLPKAAPANMSQKYDRARKALESSYGEAVKAYVKAKKDDEAAAIEKELASFRKGDEGKRTGEVLRGTWKVSVGSYKGEWTFKENGDVDSSSGGAAAGKWVIDTAKGHVLITWEGGLQDKFDLPLNPKGSTGSQVGRMNTKLDAIKIK